MHPDDESVISEARLVEELTIRHIAKLPVELARARYQSDHKRLAITLELFHRALMHEPHLRGVLSAAVDENLVRLCTAAISQASKDGAGDGLPAPGTVASRLTRLVATLELSTASLMDASDLLPMCTGDTLTALMIAVDTQLVERARGAVADQERGAELLAVALTNLAIRLEHAGHITTALQVLEEAVALGRRLAREHPTIRPGFARSLLTLGDLRAQLGRNTDALAAVEESVSMERGLVERSPGTREPALASALNHLCVRLSRLGREEAALDAIQEAIELQRLLVEGDPSRHEADLAQSLHTLASRHVAAGLPHRARSVMTEATTIRRRLARRSPALHEPSLAGSLNNLSNVLAMTGRTAEALTVIEEAVAIRRRLASEDPEAHGADLAQSLSNLSRVLEDVTSARRLPG